MSVFDSFDKAVEDRGTNVLKDLYISNTTQILQRQGTTDQALGFKSWVTIRFYPEFSWETSQQGIRSVSLLGSARSDYDSIVAGHFRNPLGSIFLTANRIRVRFTTAIKNDNYSVVLLPNCESIFFDTANNLVTCVAEPEIFVPQKTTQYFDIGIKSWNKILRAGDRPSTFVSSPLLKTSEIADMQLVAEWVAGEQGRPRTDVSHRSFTIGILHNGY